MAKEPLRSYNHQIEKLIDQGQFEEALAHCRHILQTYPKHLETYRLLGKAYLESERYGEAADILTRVLASIPDDFVANIGMSIVREDEGKLDVAIWHMERAFEVQPANTAVQDELCRLYGRRDGLEPARVHLTRGALVRMYVRGDLYHQAVAEARAALVEDSQRPDLQILLAQMCYKAGQRVEATEICSNLLTKHPYCYEANRILADILPDTKRAEDAQIYRLRINALDPYAAFTSNETPDPDRIPDNVITFDRLEWLPSAKTTEPPQWASTLGIEGFSDTGEASKIPEWFNEPAEPAEPAEKIAAVRGEKTQESAVTEQKPSEPEIQETLEQLEKNNQLPDWMKAAGWVQSTGIVEVKPIADEEDIMPTSPEQISDLQMAEIPDWLKDLAPKDAAAEPPAPVENLISFESIFTTTEETQPTLEEPPAAPLVSQEAITATATESPPGELPQASAPAQPTTAINDEDAAMAWLESLAAKQGADEETLFVKPEERTEIPPAWISEMVIPTNIEEPASGVETLSPVEELPDWLQDLEKDKDELKAEPPVIEQLLAAEAVEETAKEPPGQILSQTSEEVGVEPVAETPASLIDQDAAFAWLENLAAKQGAEEETLLVKAEDRIETPPEWITEAAVEPPVKTNEVNTAVGEIEQVSSAEANRDISTTEVYEQPIPSESAEVKQPEIPPTSQADIPIPDQPQHIPVEIAIPPVINEPPLQTAVESPQTPAGADQDAVFAWLETLAARQGADEETLLATPEDRIETPPGWIEESTEPTPQENVEAVSPELAVETGNAGGSEWLQELETTEEAKTQISDQTNKSDLSWLHELEKSTQLTSQETTPPAAPETTPEIPSVIIPTAVSEPQIISAEVQKEMPAINSEPFMLSLKQAQADLLEGKLDNAIKAYTQLINAGQFLEETIHDLRDGLYKYPVEINLLQTLGDAYVRSNRLQDALDTYTQAEDLIR